MCSQITSDFARECARCDVIIAFSLCNTAVTNDDTERLRGPFYCAFNIDGVVLSITVNSKVIQ